MLIQGCISGLVFCACLWYVGACMRTLPCKRLVFSRKRFRAACGAVLPAFALLVCCRPVRDAGAAALSLRDVFAVNGLLWPAIESAVRRGDEGAVLDRFSEWRRAQPRLPVYDFYPTAGDPERAWQRLQEEGFGPEDRPKLRLVAPVPWGDDRFGQRVWRYRLNNFTWLTPALHAHEKTGKEEYLVSAIVLAADWHRQNVEDEIENPFAWYDMAVGLRAAILASLLDAGARSTSVADEDLRVLLRSARRHLDELLDPGAYAGDYNHGLYQMLGLAALAGGFPELKRSADGLAYAHATVDRIVSTSFSAMGTHLEHSPDYHVLLLKSIEAALSCGLIRTEEILALHARMQAVLPFLVAPDGTMARIGDTHLRKVDARFLDLEGLNRDPELLWVLSAGRRGVAPAHGAWFDPEAGYAVFREPAAETFEQWQRGSYLIFFAGRHSRTHKHADDFTFEWFEGGKPLIIDAGAFNNESGDPWRQYVKSTRAHNTVEIDRGDYAIPTNLVPQPASGIRRIADSGAIKLIEASMAHHNGVRHDRVLAWAPGLWLVVVDELSDPVVPREYIQWFHFHPAVAVARTGDSFRAENGGHLLHVSSLGERDEDGSMLVKGQKEPRLQGWTSFSRDSITPNHALGFRAAGTSATFVTLFRLGGPAPQPDGLPDITSSSIGIGWREDGERIHLSIRRDAAALEARLSRSEI